MSEAVNSALLVEMLANRPLLRRKDLARRYGVSERTIDRMRLDGTLPKPRYIHGPCWSPAEIERVEKSRSGSGFDIGVSCVSAGRA